MSEPPFPDAETFRQQALAFGRQAHSGGGKIEIMPKVRVSSLAEMAVAYTPGVGHVVRHVLAHPEDLAAQTSRSNMIAIVTDGTAVLGLGNAGPRAALPVMEGKAVMFKSLVGLDCFPLCLDTPDADAFCATVAALEPSFAGINIEDVAAPACFDISRRLEDRMGVPVLHDDQFGTATAVTAAVINAATLTGRDLANTRAVINGIGAAGTATVQMLEALGIGDIIAVDKTGILDAEDARAHPHWRDIAARTNTTDRRGDLAEAMRGADIFIGLSVAGVVSADMVRSMGADAIVLSMANPEPEIDPTEAVSAGAAIVGSGRFDMPNHCNNVLAFPGLMRGAIECQAQRIPPAVCLAAAQAIASFQEPSLTSLLPSPLDLTLHAGVAEAVCAQTIALGIAGIHHAPDVVRARTLALAQSANRRAELALCPQ